MDREEEIAISGILLPATITMREYGLQTKRELTKCLQSLLQQTEFFKEYKTYVSKALKGKDENLKKKLGIPEKVAEYLTKPKSKPKPVNPAMEKEINAKGILARKSQKLEQSKLNHQAWKVYQKLQNYRETCSYLGGTDLVEVAVMILQHEKEKQDLELP